MKIPPRLSRKLNVFLIFLACSLLGIFVYTFSYLFFRDQTGGSLKTDPHQESMVQNHTIDLMNYWKYLNASNDPYFGTKQRTVYQRSLNRALNLGQHDLIVSASLALAFDYLRLG